MVFYRKFKWKPRSTGVFCTGDKEQAKGYGGLATVWPIGNFKYIWNPEIRDFLDVAIDLSDVPLRDIKTADDNCIPD